MPAVKRYLLDHESNDGVKCTREKQARTHRPFSSLIVLNIPITSLNIDSPKKDNQRKKEVKDNARSMWYSLRGLRTQRKRNLPGMRSRDRRKGYGNGGVAEQKVGDILPGA